VDHVERAGSDQFLLIFQNMLRTLVGRYKEIISETLAVVDIPFGCRALARPLGPIGESIAIGVEDMITTRT